MVSIPNIIRRHLTVDASAIARLKNPTRGGQNLTMRYRRLEQSLRGKEALQADIRAREESDVMGRFGGDELDPTQAQVSLTGTRDLARYFHGLEIPQKPKAPEADECCMSGCAVCVYDLYEESLAAYNDNLAALRATLTASEIPHETWPEGVRSRSGRSAASDTVDKGSTRGATLSAFEELEKTLEAKRAVKDVQ
ncbi:oxidoreductase-like protein [Mycena crocata]|nr:oxidoreductase-like protein [Mycena crocata]